MFTSGLITFRETLEAALVVSIVLTFLSKASIGWKIKKFVWIGITAGIFLSIVLAYLLHFFFGGLSGKTEELFEGILMFITASFLTWMILWVHKQKDIVGNIKKKVKIHMKRSNGIGIFFLILTSVFREGTETVLYLNASRVTGSSNQLLGAVIGIVLALLLGYVIFKWSMRVNLQTVFSVTSIFLLLFAAGITAHGVHEFQELGMMPIFSFDPILNISQILDHKSILGSFLRTLFGYRSKPTLFEILSYSLYIAFIFWLKRKIDRVSIKANLL